MIKKKSEDMTPVSTVAFFLWPMVTNFGKSYFFFSAVTLWYLKIFEFGISLGLSGLAFKCFYINPNSPFSRVHEAMSVGPSVHPSMYFMWV